MTAKAVGAREPAFAHPWESDELERLEFVTGQRSGWEVGVAIHSTTLGPALGGVRMWSYPNHSAATSDLRNLARGMSYKAAAAELPLGGGKGVICAPPEPIDAEQRRAALIDFADLIESLAGSYITAEDVGVGPDDLGTIAARTRYATGHAPGSGGSGDPSPFTASGVRAAMRACAAHHFGSPSLDGLTIAIVGVGSVGNRLATMLASEGASLVVSDLDPVRLRDLERVGARLVSPQDATSAACDILAPCALGPTITRANVDRLRCGIICGAANNQLTDDGLARAISDRGIVYAPDFVANAGGLISVAREVLGYGETRVTELVARIGDRMQRLLSTAAKAGCTPLEAARATVYASLGR